MLRRVASQLFWTARNLERAEWRARLVNVNYHLLVESPAGAIEGWTPLLAITGDLDLYVTLYETPAEQSVLEFFTLDDANPSSIRRCIGYARENCRALRNCISSEMWAEINSLYLDANGWTYDTLQAAGIFEFFQDLRNRFYLVSGIVESTMPRGAAYDFLTIGRTLEAAENVTRMLDAKYHFLLPHPDDVGSQLDLQQWAAVLRSASALEAYIGTFGNAMNIEHVVDFLLFDKSFPRAARYSIDRLDAALERVASGGKEGASQIPTARTLASRLRSGSAPGVIKDGLHEYLLGIQDDCAKIGGELFAKYLRFE
ncbi:MAG TPA: alpha-E domain-containing protein [Candidatus Binataceae bacterium]|nr:alpha-E domain-containing protein [Candidatus Binataceae bacterium]